MKSDLKYDPHRSIFDDSYMGRLMHSIRLYNPVNLIYSNKQLIQMKQEITEYAATGKTSKTN